MSKGSAVQILQLCSAPALELHFSQLSLAAGLGEIISPHTRVLVDGCRRADHHSCEWRFIRGHTEPNSWVRMALGKSFPLEAPQAVWPVQEPQIISRSCAGTGGDLLVLHCCH